MKLKKTLFDQLHELSKTIALQQSIQYLLDWDQETYMPAEAIEIRSAQAALMAGQIHKMKTGPKFLRLLSQLIDVKSGRILDSHCSAVQKAALREWRHDFLRSTKLSTSFVKTFTTTTSTACHVWAQARKSSSFSLFTSHLEKIVRLNRRKADLLGYKEHPYDALLDLYEPGMTTARLVPLFDHLKTALKSLLKAIQATPPIDSRVLQGDFDPAAQLEFGKKLLAAMGFSSEHSRLDLSNHPFCMPVHPRDTRMTTRINTTDVMSSILSVIHEGGHGLYNYGLPVELYGTPVCEHASLGMDEGQSRWWETRIGRSLPFWTHFFPALQASFPSFQKATLEQFYHAINIVKPSCIRVEADEVTYSLHVILRFEIEKALIEESLKIDEIPSLWNQKMEEYLGITPKNDGEGCLQDIHWSLGSLGYFPTYVLGNLYASQFFSSFEKEHPSWHLRVAQGDLLFVREWLATHVHQWGHQYSADELCQRVSGKTLDEKAYIEYLTSKYQAIYKF